MFSNLIVYGEYTSVIFSIFWGDLPPPPQFQIPQKNTQNTRNKKMHQIYPPDMWSPEHSLDITLRIYTVQSISYVLL